MLFWSKHLVYQKFVYIHTDKLCAWPFYIFLLIRFSAVQQTVAVLGDYSSVQWQCRGVHYENGTEILLVTFPRPDFASSNLLWCSMIALQSDRALSSRLRNTAVILIAHSNDSFHNRMILQRELSASLAQPCPFPKLLGKMCGVVGRSFSVWFELWQRQLQDFDLDKSSIIAFSKTIWEDALQRLRHSNWDAYHQLGYPLIYPICHDMCWIYDLARWIYARFLFQSIQLWISFHGFNTESIKYLQTNTFVETWWFLKSLSSWIFLTWIWLWVLSQASKLVPWLLGLHLCSQPRGLATTRGAALLCCGGIFDEAPLSSSKIWDEERSSFYFLCDFYVIVMISHVMFAILGQICRVYYEEPPRGTLCLSRYLIVSAEDAGSSIYR